MKVWYKGVTKKKGRKRCLVASATHSVEDLLRRQHNGPSAYLSSPFLPPSLHSHLPSSSSLCWRRRMIDDAYQIGIETIELEIKLGCYNVNKRNVSSRGKSSNSNNTAQAYLHVKILPPRGVEWPRSIAREGDVDDEVADDVGKRHTCIYSSPLDRC